MPRLHRCTTPQTACNKKNDSLHVQMYFSPSCTRAFKGRVRSPRDHVHWVTALIAALSRHGVATDRDLDMHCVRSPHCTPSKSPYPSRWALDLYIFRSVHFFLTPPNTFPLISVIAFYTHGILRSPSFICGVAVVYGSISILLPTWQYYSYLCTVQRWRFSVYVA